MKRLTEQLGGPRLWVKREDCTGLLFGGNKLRKLDYVLSEAMAAGADTLVSGGVVQSNSQRQVAAAAAKLGLAGLTKTLYLEGAKNNIKVNTLAPVAATRMTEELLPPQALQLMKPEAITPAVLYLLGDNAPTRTILGAGAGSFAQIKIIETEGINLPESEWTPEAIEAFVVDRSPDAYARMVERTLASPRYGERWAQHWLDLAHYADSNGFELDADRPDAWRYRDWVIAALGEATGQPFTEARDHFEAQGTRDSLVELSGVLRTIAVGLTKICNDLRWMSSGPTTGLTEIHLPDLQPGSSIMPGKVNPSVPEMVNQVCYQVMGCDQTIALACEAGQLELNVMMPLMAFQVNFSATILGNGAELPRFDHLVEREVFVAQPGASWIRPRAPFRFHGVPDRPLVAPRAVGTDERWVSRPTAAVIGPP